MGTIVGRVAEIRRYPVKSMTGELLAEAVLDRLGIPGDRRFAVRDATTGKVVSAKQPRHAALLDCRATLGGGELLVTTADGRRFAPADPADRAELDAALSSLLGRPVRFEAATGDDGVYESWWPEIEGLALSGITTDFPVGMATGKGTFVDLAALHVVTSASLDHLRTLAPGSAITPDRFRPGILIDGGTPGAFAENDWAGRTARIGSAAITVSMVAPRCVMTTLAQGALVRDPGVLQALATHNRLELGGGGAFACLGAYAEVDGPGTIAVGDPVELD
jgi:uncharacterized protein YcbX